MMLKLWIVLVALAVGSYAFEEDCCSAEDKKEVAFLWHAAWHSSYTDRRVKIMTAVWEDLVHKHPGAREFMTKKGIEAEGTPEFRAFMIKVVHGLDNLVNLLDEPLILEEQLHYMADRYGAKVGLHKSYFEAILDSFETVFPKVSSCFNFGAWHRCLNRLGKAVSEKVPE